MEGRCKKRGKGTGVKRKDKVTGDEVDGERGVSGLRRVEGQKGGEGGVRVVWCDRCLRLQ